MNTTPIGEWIEVGCIHDSLPLNGLIEFEDVNSFLARDQILTLLANTKDLPAYLHKALFAQFQTSLRADSEGAPSTHREAKTTDESAGNSIWQDGERSELKNHEKNSSWQLISRSEVPKGRRIHKLVWVYKIKRSGQVKVRLCVQGCTLQPGVDYDQTFSSTLRHCSARTLCAHAARKRCFIRGREHGHATRA